MRDFTLVEEKVGILFGKRKEEKERCLIREIIRQTLDTSYKTSKHLVLLEVWALLYVCTYTICSVVVCLSQNQHCGPGNAFITKSLYNHTLISTTYTIFWKKLWSTNAIYIWSRNLSLVLQHQLPLRLELCVKENPMKHRCLIGSLYWIVGCPRSYTFIPKELYSRLCPNHYKGSCIM